MNREPLLIDATRDELVEMAACALALAHAHQGEFGAAGRGVTEMFTLCSKRLTAIADSDDSSFVTVP